jgi:hypothetical protein
MTIPATISPRVAKLLKKARAARARLVFGLDATASRSDAWDLATSLTAGMLVEASRVGSLDVQLVHFGGDEFHAGPWCSDTLELVERMRSTRCVAGRTCIEQVFRHVKTENQREKVNALAFVGDASEERVDKLLAAAKAMDVPAFMFQEGHGTAVYLPDEFDEYTPQSVKTVEQVFREIAKASGGAYARFDSGSAQQLGALLAAIAAFATGGMTALANQRSESARLLLGQMKK